MDRCRTCGSPRSRRCCPQGGTASREPPVLTDGGERAPDDGDDAEHRGERERWDPEKRRGDGQAGNPPGSDRQERSERRAGERRPGREPNDRPGGQSHSGDRERRNRSRDGERPPGRGNQRPPGNDRRRRDRDERRGRQPRERQGGQTGRAGQRTGDGTPPGPPGDGRQQPSGGDGSGRFDLGRRAFLLGGAGAAGLVAGGWWFFGRGYDGAKAVVAEYLDALDGNNWGAAGRLYHSDSEFRRMEREGRVTGYEAYLSEPRVERWEATSVEIDELYETDRVEDVEENNRVSGFDPAEHDVTEFRYILAVVSEDLTGWDGLGSGQDAQRKSTYRYTTARTSGGDWTMWWAGRS